MSMFSKIAAVIGWDSGSNLRGALAALAKNFELIEPEPVDSAAADFILTLAARVITRSNAGAQTLTVPTNATVALPIGTVVDVIQTGAGALTFVAAGGVTINKVATKSLVMSGRYGVGRLRKVAANTWNLSGDLTIV